MPSWRAVAGFVEDCTLFFPFFVWHIPKARRVTFAIVYECVPVLVKTVAVNEGVVCRVRVMLSWLTGSPLRIARRAGLEASEAGDLPSRASSQVQAPSLAGTIV